MDTRNESFRRGIFKNERVIMFGSIMGQILNEHARAIYRYASQVYYYENPRHEAFSDIYERGLQSIHTWNTAVKTNLARVNLAKFPMLDDLFKYTYLKFVSEYFGEASKRVTVRVRVAPISEMIHQFMCQAYADQMIISGEYLTRSDSHTRAIFHEQTVRMTLYQLVFQQNSIRGVSTNKPFAQRPGTEAVDGMGAMMLGSDMMGSLDSFSVAPNPMAGGSARRIHPEGLSSWHQGMHPPSMNLPSPLPTPKTPPIMVPLAQRNVVAIGAKNMPQTVLTPDEIRALNPLPDFSSLQELPPVGSIPSTPVNVKTPEVPKAATPEPATSTPAPPQPATPTPATSETAAPSPSIPSVPSVPDEPPKKNELPDILPPPPPPPHVPTAVPAGSLMGSNQDSLDLPGSQQDFSVQAKRILDAPSTGMVGPDDSVTQRAEQLAEQLRGNVHVLPPIRKSIYLPGRSLDGTGAL